MRAFCEEVAHYVASSLPPTPPSPPQPRRFLGLDKGSWMKLFLGWALAVGTFVFTWYNTVNSSLDDLKARPTAEQVKEIIHEDIQDHSNSIHPPTEERLKYIEGEQKIIRESQIRQEAVDMQQTETLKEIRDDVKRIRRSHQ